MKFPCFIIFFSIFLHKDIRNDHSLEWSRQDGSQSGSNEWSSNMFEWDIRRNTSELSSKYTLLYSRLSIQYRHRFSLQRKPLPNGGETPSKLCVLPAFEHRFQNQPIRWAFLKTINAQKRSATPETLWHFYPIKSSFGGNAVMVTITGKAFVIVYETNQWKWFIFGNAVACVLKN